MPPVLCHHRQHFNPLPPCGGRPGADGRGGGSGEISIHSLRVEGDITIICYLAAEIVFQSTPSVWRETGKESSQIDVQFISIHSLRVEGDPCAVADLRQLYHFNPLPPCGGRRSGNGEMLCHRLISIHSLRVEGDSVPLCAFV